MWTPSNEQVQTLRKLGLTFCEAKTLLALSHSGILTAKTTSTLSKVPQQDVYRIMRRLQELSLVEVIIGVPNKFRALPMQDAVSILLNRKETENKTLREEAVNLLSNAEKDTSGEYMLHDGSQFILLPRKEMNIKRRREATESVEKTLDIITSHYRLAQWLLSCSESTKKILKEGKKVRIIIDKPENEDKLREALKSAKFPEYSLLEIRYSTAYPDVVLSLCDDKMTILATEPVATLGEDIALLSNNHCLAKLARSYFEIMWRTAIKRINAEHGAT